MNTAEDDGFPFDDSLCEACGYALRGLSALGTCPECGQAIEASHPRHRPGLPWQVERSWASFWRTWWMVVTRPRESFRRMRVSPNVGDLTSVQFILLSIALVGVLYTGPLGMLVGVEALGMAVMLGFMLPFLTMIEMVVVAFYGWRRNWRMSLKTAFQITSFSAAGFVGALPAWLGLMLLIYALSRLDYLAAVAIAVLGFPVLIGASLLYYEILVYIGMRQVRFANPPNLERPAPRESGDAAEDLQT